ncbi:hypothetical protein HN928_02905, partial [bacterium]|nr:hypothetical protein [bacterium]
MIKLSKFGLAKLLLWGTLAVVLSQPVFGTTAWVTPPDDFQNIQIGAEYTEAGTAETTVHPNSGSLDLTNINNYEFEHVPNVADIKKNFYVEFMIKTSSQA